MVVQAWFYINTGCHKSSYDMVISCQVQYLSKALYQLFIVCKYFPVSVSIFNSIYNTDVKQLLQKPMSMYMLYKYI